MKNSIISQIKAKALFYILTILLIVIVFIDPFSIGLSSYLKAQIESISLSLGILVDLKTIAWAASSSEIPLISGISSSSLDTLSTAIKYLSWSDILVTAQLLLLSLSNSILLKIILIITFLGSLIPKFKTVFLKILVFILLINPGLPAYIHCVKFISSEIKLDSGDDLSKHLQDTHDAYEKKVKANQAKELAQKKNQLKKAKAEGKNHVSLLKGIEDKAEDDIKEVTTKVEEGVSQSFLVLKDAIKEIKIKTINLFSSILIQFILLPFLFFYGLFALFKKFMSGTTTDSFLEDTVMIEALALIVIVALSYGDISGKGKENPKAKVPHVSTSKTESLAKAEPTKVPVDAKPALGIDVSHFQGDVDWEEIRSHKISFAYTKATQGRSYVDTRFNKNWSDMLTAEITRGAYHFYSSEDAGKEQALHFIKTVKELKKGDLPPVLDLEQGSINGKVDVENFQKEVKIWLKTVEEKFGIKPIIYTNNPFANEYLNHSDFADYMLWVAEYGVKKPKTPIAWQGKGWSIWQRTERGNIEGEVGNVDHDTSRVSLKKLVIQ